MMKSIVLVILAAFVSSSTPVLAQAPDSKVAPASSKLRGTAAAGVPAAQRKLQTTNCYQDGGNGQASEVPCVEVGSCSAFSCCPDLSGCVGLGQFLCEIASGFAIENVEDKLCPYKFSCCY